MRYGVLGPLEVVDDQGNRVDLGTPRQRAVLAILVVNANRVVSLDRLIDELWGDTPPAAATSSLQAYVSNLRKVLEPDRAPRTPAKVLVLQPPGYVLRCRPEEVDAIAFADRVTSGRGLLDSDPQAARRILEEALATWRGPALCDFVNETFAAAEIDRLEELRATAEEDLVDAALACGDVALAAAQLQRLVPAAPLRERRRAQEMMALYRSGRKAEALRAYESVRALLADELGIDPSPALQRLHQQILDQDVDLGSHPTPAPAARAITPEAAPPDTELADTELADIELADIELADIELADAAVPFVGREAELAELQAMLDAARGRRTRLAVITGEPGIGKTRLAEEVVARARRAAWVVAWGRCHDDEGAPPLWPWMQTLRTVLDASAVAPTDSERDDLATLLPELAGSALETDDVEAARFRQFDAVTKFLERAAADRPVLLVLDDAHWADASSLRLLRFVATYSRRARLAILVTAREHDGPHPDALMQAIGDLTRQPSTLRVMLERLSPEDVELYVRRASALVQAGVAPELYARSDGNPFFVCELLKLLDSESVRGASVDEIPIAVGDVIRRRLARLPDETQDLLRVAAASGRTFDIGAVATACRLDVDDALDRIEPALLTGIVRSAEQGALQFSHALVSEAIEADLSPMRRARMHLQLARVAIEQHTDDLDSHLSEIGRHLELAGTIAPAAEVVEYARRAAEAATHRLAFDEAVVACERVVRGLARLDPSDEERLEALLALALARLRAGDLAGARSMQKEMLDLAESVDDVEVLARSALAFDSPAGGQWRNFGAVSWPLVSAFERVLGSLPPGDSVLRSRTLSGLGVELYYDDERRMEVAQLARDGAAMAERLGDPVLLASALNNLIVAGKIPGRHVEQLAAARQIVALEQRGVAPDAINAGRMHELRLSLRAGETATFAADVAVLVERAEHRRDPTMRTLLAWAETTAAFFAGDLEAAEHHAKDAASRHERTGAWGSLEAYALHMELIRREQGRLDEVQAVLDSVISASMPPAMHLLRALVAAERGDVEGARAALPEQPLPSPFDYTWLPYMVCLATVVTVVESPLGRTLYDELLPFRSELVVLDGSFVSYGSVEHYLGVLAASVGAPAEEHFRAALAVHDRVGATPWAARTRMELAAWLRERDPEEAAALLAEAHALVAPTQLGVLVDEIARVR